MGYLLLATALASWAVKRREDEAARRVHPLHAHPKVAEIEKAGGERSRVYATSVDEEADETSDAAGGVREPQPATRSRGYEDYLYEDQETADIAASMLQRAWRVREPKEPAAPESKASEEAEDEYLYEDQETVDIAASTLQRAWRGREEGES